MNVLELFKKITTFIFDIDGVLTDGSILLLENGLQARQMNIKDGYALQLAVKNNYRILIVSGAGSIHSVQRLQKLGLTEVHTFVSDKKDFITDYLKKNNLSPEQVLYMGDDIPDLQAMKVVGLPCCPADAVNEIKEASKYISPVNGGKGCVRDVIEKVMKLNDHWQLDPTVTSR